MNRISEMVTGKIMPTPGAVMEAAKLLAQEIGDLVVIDMGGATTDVHSVTEGSDEINSILIAPEPVAKRTVEGDLGLFVSAPHVIECIGKEALSKELGFDVTGLPKNAVPTLPEEKKLVFRLAQEVVRLAVARHAGRVKHLYGPTGRITFAEGKDLTQVKWIIGTGGFLVRWPEAKAILEELKVQKSTELLPSKSAQVLIDHDYIMSSAGLMVKKYPSQALALMKKSLRLN